MKNGNDVIIETFSRNENPQKAADCVQTFAKGLSGNNHTSSMFAAPDQGENYWGSYVHNLLLTNPQNKIIHALYTQDDKKTPVCVGIAYEYSEHVEYPENPVNYPPGWVTFNPIPHKDGPAAQEEMAVFMKAGKDAFKSQTPNFFYVAILATLPTHQGNGYGGVMLKYLTHLANQKKLPMYIEASSEASARLYERAGFVRRDNGKQVWYESDEPNSAEFTVILLDRKFNPNEQQGGRGRRGM